MVMHDPAVADLTDLDQLVGRGAVRPAYQPIVDLTSGEVVGYEALARWPDVPGTNPEAVFAAARLDGRTAELDWTCRLAALEGALSFGLGRERVLFVNVEPEALGTAVPADARVLDAAHRDLRVVLELTERALMRRPAELLRVVQWARSHGWGIALDDVGADPASLALLPFLAPDVIKLDMSLVRHRPTPDQASIMAAVMSHSEMTGATILAEGIETDTHLDQALALGATLGQGWALGLPGPLRDAPRPSRPVVPARQAPPIAVTPFAAMTDHQRLRIGRKGLLLDLSLHIESQALHLRPAPVVLSAFQYAARFTPATVARYALLADRCPLVGALAVDLTRHPVPKVHTSALAADDPLVGEWTVAVLGSHYSAALIARDLGDDGPDHDRRFEFAVTHDRDLVVAAARSLMARITG
ncbi:MAG: EAL domain-containing protein [Actinobacteria bacterium]|nr:EAL domain-containing protein [Actinomycetota bacterium]